MNLVKPSDWPEWKRSEKRRDKYGSEKAGKCTDQADRGRRSGSQSEPYLIVLNGRGDVMRISKETQKRVRDMAKEMNYQPNIYARRLRSAAHEKAGRVIAVLWNSAYSDLMMGQFFRGLHEYQKKT